MTDLTAQQALGMEKIKQWYEGARDRGVGRDLEWVGSTFSASVFRWFGYAGTGKTFSAARVPEALDIERVAFGTYTGKAASVLRRSLGRYGVNYPVTTIHSAIYFPTTSAEARAALESAHMELIKLERTADYLASVTLSPQDMEDRVAMEGWASVLEFYGHLDETRALIPELEANARRLSFEFNPDGPWAGLDLIVLDEVSMVNAKLAADIESYGVPILVLGDPAQLPPVEGGGYYTDAEPDHLLTDVQRQALDNPVLELATRIRESTTGNLGLVAGEDTTPASLAEAMEHDQVLCWTNKRRWAMINAMRRKLGRPEGAVVPGDRIMCLTNNKDLAVFNGEQFEVLAVTEGILGPTLTVQTETGLTRDIATFADGFQGQELQIQAKNSGQGMRGRRMLATFAQAITVHKAQGSEWDSVYIVNETPGLISMTAKRKGSREGVAQGRQWLYTAVTRAKERVTITAPSQGR
jgi:exodeoxyribonuclease-5